MAVNGRRYVREPAIESSNCRSRPARISVSVYYRENAIPARRNLIFPRLSNPGSCHALDTLARGKERDSWCCASSFHFRLTAGLFLLPRLPSIGRAA